MTAMAFPFRIAAPIARAAYDGALYRDIAAGRLDGPPIAPIDGVPWLAHVLVERIRDRYDAVVVITGAERISKSTLALRLIQAVETESDVPWSLDRLCYSARDTLVAYKGAAPMSSIWLDEGARGLWAGDTFEPEQRALTKALTLVGETYAILFVCAPDIWLLAKKVRGRRAVFWAHVERRGTPRIPAPSMARLHERDERLRYLPSDALGLARSRRCPSIAYMPYADDAPAWAQYHARKLRKLGEFYTETIAEIDAVDRKRLGIKKPRSDDD